MALPEKTEEYRYRDYVTWPDDVRFELIEGEIYDMAPGPGRAHQSLLMELARQMANYLIDKPCDVYPAPFDVRLPESGESSEDATTVVQPDISVICDEEKLDDAGCIGAPDVTVEIVSPSTASKDQVRKLRLYERHGVREYWIVHPVDKVIRVYRLTDEGIFGRDEVYDSSMTFESQVLEGFSLVLRSLFG